MLKIMSKKIFTIFLLKIFAKLDIRMVPRSMKYLTYQVGCNQKCNQQSTNAGKKSIETAFDCHLSPVGRQMAMKNTVSIDFLEGQWGDKWQSKKLFLLIFDLSSLILLAFLIAANLVC